MNVWGPIRIGKSTSPITVILDPSKSLTTNAFGFIIVFSTVSFIRVVLGMTFKDKPISTNTL